MATVKVKRKVHPEIEGSVPQVMEVEEAEVLETDERVPDQPPGNPPAAKTLPESEHNSKMAEQRRKHDAELKAVRDEFTAFKKSIEDKEKAANEAAAEKVEALRKDLPESVGKLLDKLTPVEQLEWLSDPANTITKQTIPPLPEPANQQAKTRRAPTVI